MCTYKRSEHPEIEFNDASCNRVERVESVLLVRLGRGFPGPPCKNCNFPIDGGDPRDPRIRRILRDRYHHPRSGYWPDTGTGVAPGKRLACSPLPDEEPESAAAPGLPLAPVLLFVDESRPGPAWTPRSARVPALSPTSYTERRSDGLPAPGRVCDGAPVKEKGILDKSIFDSPLSGKKHGWDHLVRRPTRTIQIVRFRRVVRL